MFNVFKHKACLDCAVVGTKLLFSVTTSPNNLKDYLKITKDFFLVVKRHILFNKIGIIVSLTKLVLINFKKIIVLK